MGGIVKLQHLAARFPNEPLRFNILYLVTSRLPDSATTLATWARRKHAKVVVNQNGVAYPGWYGAGWHLVNAPMVDLLGVADHVFYQSEFCRTSADRYARPAAGPNEILHNPVDTQHFTPASRMRVDDPLVLLLGGSQDQWYRVESALETLALLVARGLDVRLLITGRLRWTPDADRCLHELTQRVRALGVADRVTLVGPYAQADAPDIFRRAHILLHTKYNDPCPGVVLEGLASGLPVVYSSSGGVPELVGGDAGVGVPAELSWDRDIPPNPAALADGVLMVRQHYRHYADAARQRAVDRFDVRPWLARHAQVFEALVH